MRVHWTDNAIKHLVSTYEYIGQNSPVYAQTMVDKLTRRSEQLADFPMSGRRDACHCCDFVVLGSSA